MYNYNVARWWLIWIWYSVPRQRCRMSGLPWKIRGARWEWSGSTLSKPCRRMEHGAQWQLEAQSSSFIQQQEGLVAMRIWPWMAGRYCRKGRGEFWMSVLHREVCSGWFQWSCYASSENRRAMGQHAEKRSDPGNGNAGKSQSGMVEMRWRACLENGHLLLNRKAEMWMSRMRRKSNTTIQIWVVLGQPLTQVSPASLSTPIDAVEYFKRTLIADYMPQSRVLFLSHYKSIASINPYIRTNVGYIQTKIVAVWAKI